MVSINPETRVATFTAASDWNGNEEVVFRVVDGDALDDVDTTVVSVAPVNDPPVAGRLEPVYPPSGSSGVAIPLSDLISDRDDELTNLQITAEVEGSATAQILPDGSALIVSGDQAGRSVIRLTVTDTSGASAQTRQVAVVLGANEQVAPEILSLPLMQLRAGRFTTLSLNEFARDDQPVSNLLWASAAPDELLDTIGSDNVLRVDADASFSGESVVVLVATDQAGLTDTATLPVRVAGEGQDLPPLISLPGKIGVVRNESSTPTEIALDPLVIDLDDVDNQIRWAVFTASQGLVINIEEDRTLVVSAGADFAQGGSGIGSISLIARNTKDLADTAAVPVIVSVPGQEPQMTSLPEVTLDSLAAEVRVDLENAVGLEQVQFAVQDPAGNTDIGVLEVMVVRGGLPPQISGLLQITLLAAPEQSLSLDLYVIDTDTPDDQINWVVHSEPGVNARIQDRRLFLSVPAGQEGGRQLTLTASDPQGNEAEAILQLTIESDTQAPELSLEIKRNLVVADLIEVVVASDEPLPQAPSVRINGAEVEVLTLADDSLFVAATTISPSGELQLLEVLAEGADRAGNVSTRELTVTMRWMIDEGGTLPYTDGVAIANVPDAAAGPRRLAILYRLGEEETPPESAGEPVYAIDLDSGEPVMDPYTINLFQGEQSGQGRGLLHWEPSRQVWEEVPTIVDEAAGWLTASIRESGLYRPGAVTSTNTRPTQKLANHPNPFPAAGSDNTQIEYEISVSGPVRLEVFNVLGQRVRLLVEETFQDVGVWTVIWDGTDDAGRTLGSGVYFYELAERQGVQCRSLVLFR